MMKTIKQLFLIILPILYILYVVYLRLFLVRNPRILHVELSYLGVTITLIIVISLSCKIYSRLKKEGLIKEKQNKNKFLLRVNAEISKIYKVIQSLWRNLYNIIVINSLKINLLIIKFVKFLDKNIKFPFAIMIILFFELLPKMILVTTFLWDIFFLEQFYYFYKCLFLLLLPLIYSILYNILLLFYIDNYAVLDSYLDKLTVIEDNGEYNVLYTFADDFEPPNYVKNIHDFLENHYFPVKNIPNIVARFESIKINYNINWLFIAILILHLLGWLTILIWGIL